MTKLNGVLPNGRSARSVNEPYASIPASQFSCGHMRRLAGCAIRVLLMAHANWTPDTRAVMPVGRLAEHLAVDKGSVSLALQQLQPTFLKLFKAASRPGSMGHRCGAAAVYDVEGRQPGTAHRVFEKGDRNFDGSFRITCKNLRALAGKLSTNEARILVCLVLPGHRDRHGVQQNSAPVALSGREIANALEGISARTADAAIKGLVAKGLIELVTPAIGRRAGTYQAVGLAASTIRRGKPRKVDRKSQAAWFLQGGCETAHKSAGSREQIQDARPVKSSKERLVRSFATGATGLRADSPPENNRRSCNDKRAA